MLRTVASTASALRSQRLPRLPKPPFEHNENTKGLFLGVLSMREHMTSEGWQLTKGFEEAGYTLCGRGLSVDSTSIPQIIAMQNPGIVVVQDKREWDVKSGEFHNPSERFVAINEFKKHNGIFRMTVLKDAQQKPPYHAQAAKEMGCHAWIAYYHPQIVARVAPYVRQQHIVRTYHCIDPVDVPEFNPIRERGTLVSGALSRAYPFRETIFRNSGSLGIDTLPHPGYHRRGSNTHEYMQTLSKYAVSISTSSVYGYALRKIIESTVCGCRVITDLPVDDVLPAIDGNLIRVSPKISMRDLESVIRDAERTYCHETQRRFSEAAVEFYDYRAIGLKLVRDIESMRKRY